MPTLQDHAPTKRVIDILMLIAEKEDGYTLSELSRGIGSPVSTVSGIVRTLCSTNFLEYDSGRRRYQLGFAAYAVSASYIRAHSLFRCVVSEMHRVVEACSEICELGVLVEGNVLYMAKVETNDPIRVVSQVGARLPANCTSTGKALLADHDMQALHRLYPDGLPIITDKSITDFSALHAQLAAIKAGGLARSRCESTRQAESFALPLRFQDEIIAGISISVPIFRMSDDKVQTIERELRRAQQTVEALMLDRNESLAPNTRQ